MYLVSRKRFALSLLTVIGENIYKNNGYILDWMAGDIVVCSDIIEATIQQVRGRDNFDTSDSYDENWNDCNFLLKSFNIINKWNISNISFKYFFPLLNIYWIFKDRDWKYVFNSFWVILWEFSFIDCLIYYF